MAAGEIGHGNERGIPWGTEYLSGSIGRERKPVCRKHRICELEIFDLVHLGHHGLHARAMALQKPGDEEKAHDVDQGNYAPEDQGASAQV